MHKFSYSSTQWQELRARAIVRDNGRCSVGRLVGGECHATLHVDHIVPVSKGGAPLDIDNVITVCQSHHPSLEALRRRVATQPEVKCGHFHPYPSGREACERRLRERHLVAA